MTIRIRQLDRTGDTVLAEIDTESAAAVDEANRIIAEARSAGNLVYTQDSKHRGHAVASMADVTDADVIIAPRMVGG